MTDGEAAPAAAAADDDDDDDDADIPNEEVVYRRLRDAGPSFVAVDQLTGVRRPSSGAFQPDDDGVSVYRRSILLANDLGPDDVRNAPLNLIASVEVGDLRSITLGVRDDPWPADIDEPDHPRNAAHALIKGLEALGKNPRRRRQKQLVALASVTLIEG